MKTKIDDTINSLTDLKAVIQDTEDARAELDATNEALAKAKDELATTTTDLAKVKAGFTLAQIKSLKEFEEANFAKRKEYESICVKVDAAKAKLDELDTLVNSASDRHKSIEASIASLRKQIG